MGEHTTAGSRESVAENRSARVVLAIPAFEPGLGLRELVERVVAADKESVIAHIVLIDDGSGPAFSSVFDRAASADRAHVIRNAVNLGKGAALKAAFNHALVTWPECVGVVTADADGQHAAADIVEVARALAEDSDQLVMGVREFGRSVPLRSRFGNLLTRGVFRVVAGYSLSDTQTGLRGLPRELCAQALRIPLNGYEFELEALMAPDAIRSKSIAIREIPIETIYLDDNQSSHFQPLRDSMKVYYVFLRFCGSSAVTALVDFLVFIAVMGQADSVAVSQVCSRSAAVLVSFFLARHLVFHSFGRVFKSFAKFVTLVVVMGVVSYAMIDLLYARFGVPVLAAKLVAESVLFIGNFAIQRSFIFVGRSDDPGSGAA